MLRSTAAISRKARNGDPDDDNHLRIVTLFDLVRAADGPAARAEAFEQCKPALRLHDLAQHCNADRSTVLASVIVAELDAWSTADAGWMKRFYHLETAFRAHVAKYARH